MQPSNVLALLINMALMRALSWIKTSFSTTYVEADKQMAAVVANCQRHTVVLQQLQILLAFWHRFGRVMMSAHGQNNVVSVESPRKLINLSNKSNNRRVRPQEDASFHRSCKGKKGRRADKSMHRDDARENSLHVLLVIEFFQHATPLASRNGYGRPWDIFDTTREGKHVQASR
jgi:hypothetical protein